MSYYMVGAIDIHDEEAYESYVTRAGEALAAFGVEYLSLDHAPDAIEGTLPAGYMMIVRFASKEEWQRFYASDLYQQAIPYRLRASHTRFLAGLAPVAS